MTDEERDPKISRRYRELPPEEPPRELDAAVLAAARREVEARPAPLVAPTGRRRWYVPVAAAAVIVLSVVVTLQVEREQPDVDGPAPRAEKAAPAPEPQPAAKAAQAPATAAPAAAPPVEAASRKAAREPGRFAPDPARSAPPLAAAAPAAETRLHLPAPAEKPAPRAEDSAAPSAAGSVAGVLAGRDARESTIRERAEPQSALEMRAKRAGEAAETPERQLERIADLRRQGRHDEADKALAEFRKRYPDYKIPEKTLERVERR